MPDNQKYIPAVGTTGYFQLLTPFDTLISINERYTLKSVRKISDYLASNENVHEDIYIANGIESTYQDDLMNDIEILGIQSERGAWVYVPVRYVKCYPIVNGIPYRTVSIVLPMQPIPVNTDLSGLLSQLSGIVTSVLGFTPNPKVVETSRSLLVSTESHAALQIDRAIHRNVSTPQATILKLNNDLTIANNKVTALEDYIREHPP